MNTVERVVAMYRDRSILGPERRARLAPLMDRLSSTDRDRIWNQVSIILTALSLEDEKEKEKSKISRAHHPANHLPNIPVSVTMEEFVAMNAPAEGLQ